MFIWMALWSIGCAPAMLNCNLEGESLLHTLKYSNSSLMLVDADLSERITKLQDTIVGDLKMRIVFLNDIFKIQISEIQPKRPEDSFRANVKGDNNQALIYTR
jgi:hypothetical protein